MSSRNTLQQEMREVVWLASMVGGLSVASVGLAVVVALAMDGWPSRFLAHI